MSNEIWKDIKGYESLYQISNEGRVRSLDRSVIRYIKKNGQNTNKNDPEAILTKRKLKGRILKSRTNNKGYHHVELWKNGEKKDCLVHRLVASEFIENKENYPQVNHRDEDKDNNSVNNLEWCDATYNNNYGTRTERATKSKNKNKTIPR